MKKLRWFALGLFSFGTLAAAQTGPSLVPRTAAEREAQQKAHNRIFLNVLVTDAAGHPVSGLTREDFTVLDDQQPQKIEMLREFDSHTRPVRILIVFDAINSDRSTIHHIREDLARYFSLSQEPLPYPISLILLSNGGQTESAPSTDRAALAQTLAQIPKNTYGADCDDIPTEEGVGGAMSRNAERMDFTANCLYARFEQSMKALSQLLKEQINLQGRTILIWTGPGWPLAKHLSGNYMDELVQLTTDLGMAQTTLYAASPGEFGRLRDTPQAPREAVDSVAGIHDPSRRDQAGQQNLTLPRLAEQSGGRTFEKTNLGKVLDTSFADVSRYYLISYDPARSTMPDQARSIAVEVNRPGVEARTVTSYFAQP